MPKLFTIDDSWTHLQWVSTGGTRAKKFLQSPDGDYFYFKRSQLKPGKDYTYEFWNEIIASEIGQLLGFNMLEYHLAIYNDIAGCISKSMIAENEELIEILKYLQAFSPNYNPSLKDHQKWYTFQMIENSLERVKQKEAMNEVVSVLILDALIGNGDRHQENMAFIRSQHLISELVTILNENRDEPKSFWANIFFKIMKSVATEAKRLKAAGQPIPKSLYKQSLQFSPIYDSGSSLGRELTEGKVNQLLQSEQALEIYIDKGPGEIHWQGGLKLSHFDLLKQIMATSYKEVVIAVVQRLQSQWIEDAIKAIVMNVDKDLPETHAAYAIPPNRKQLILKLLTSRFKRLMKLLN